MASAKGLINSTVDLFKRSSLIGKLMIKKSMMERNRKQRFQNLGELTYALYKTNVMNDPALKGLIEDIDIINKEIRKTSGKLGDFVYVDKNNSDKNNASSTHN
ncbi:MAG: hypothetical protein WCQ47_02810 [bacterium]